MKPATYRFCLLSIVLSVFVTFAAGALDRSGGFSSPEMVMAGWSRSVRLRDTDMFAESYWDNARQLVVSADGSRATVHGVDAIRDNFGHLLAEHPADTSGFWLPVPLRYQGSEEGSLQFIYRDQAYPAINMVQFEERDGHWAIVEQHIYWRNLTGYAPGPAQQEYDVNANGSLSPAEQNSMVADLWLVTSGRHGATSFLDEQFDFNEDGYISSAESRRARSVLLRDRLRGLPAFYPGFVDVYLNPTAAGEITIHSANACLADFIDSETAIRPQPATGKGGDYAVADFDQDGWIGPDEIFAYAEMIIRVLAAVPTPAEFSKSTDGTAEEILRWTDANGNGAVSDAELSDLGYLVFAALSGDPVVASAPLCRFDQDRDFLLSVPEQDALRAYFAIELMPQTVARFSDAYPAVGLFDTDSSGELTRIEISSAMDLIADPEGSVGTRVNSPLDRSMDRKPEDGRLDEWEVWSAVSALLAASSRQWLESRTASLDAIVFERDTDRGEGIAEEGDVALGSGTRPVIMNDVASLQRMARLAAQASGAGTNRAGDGGPSDGSNGAGDLSGQTISMPAITVSDDAVRLGVRFQPIFPVMYKWYADRYIGHAFIENTTDVEITDVIARVDIPRHVDSILDSRTVPRVGPGEVAQIEIPALLTESAVLAITEGRTAAANVEVQYTTGEDRRTISQTVQLEFYDRNAIVWDDDRKASAFVTARDDQVLLFSGNLNAAMYDQYRAGLSRELQLAMLMFDGLAEHGMVYRTDPSSPYADYSKDALAIDYLQFPRQTLAFRGGDCDDLTVGYVALLEAAGVPAAFVTTPGHIFAAVQLQTSEDEARRTYLFPDDLIYLDGAVWLPVEVTALRGTFLEAWSVGGRRWREAQSAGEAQLIPVRVAWEEYAPVGFSGFTLPLAAPDAPRVVERCATDLTHFVAREIADREVAFIERLDANPLDHDLRNRLGALYARYGLMDRAAEQFSLIVDDADFFPALLNLGNISYLAGDFHDALGYYDRALTAEPESGPAILGVARASLEVEDYPRVRAAYDQLKVVSPDLASEHSYLESRAGSSRAAAASDRARPVAWVGER